MNRPDRLYGGYVFDLDGTLYLGEALLPGAAATVAAIRAAGARVAFLTNNPLRLPVEYAAKLSGLGIPTDPSHVVSSTDSLVRYLRRRAAGARLLLVSEPLLVGILTAAGFEIVDDPDRTDVLIVSFDRTFDYAKLRAAYRAVRAGARIVATNPDPYCPTPDGGLPDCGALLAAIETASGGRAEAVVGKPSRHMAETLLERLGSEPADTLMVGDRLSTDTRLAREAGMVSALVLTGATTEADLAGADLRPDFVLAGVSGVLPGAPGEHTDPQLIQRLTGGLDA
jgi:HAD superfamily hydrolase (TIGR01450 family)